MSAPRSPGPTRILFVLAWLPTGGVFEEAAALARLLDHDRYRIDAVVCFRQPDQIDHSEWRMQALGIDVDIAPYELDFQGTVDYLANKVAAYDVVVACQNVADIYPALERMHWRPPLIEHGSLVAHALAGPKHFTSRYVGETADVRDAAALRMPGRAGHAVAIAPMGTPHGDNVAAARQWQAMFEAVLAERQAAPEPSLFSSIVLGGFECSSHRLRSGERVDVIDGTGHGTSAASDYRELAAHGITAVRDGLRWHRIEPRPGCFDWSSFLPMLRASEASGTQVIWDLLHYGWPDDIDVWSARFVDRLVAFAQQVAMLVREETDTVPFYCPVNEISFLAWGGGDVAYLNPFARGRGIELKVQLARAAIGMMRAIRDVDPRARFVHCEPVINVLPGNHDARARNDAEGWRRSQYQAWDMLAGRAWPQLGGEPGLLDILGLNYYNRNQWLHGSGPVEVTHADVKPFRALLAEVYARYGRPLFVAETGIEDEPRAAWFDAVVSEVRAARRAGIPVEGICLYPVVDYPGWDDQRECRTGLLGMTQGPLGRAVHQPLAASIARLAGRF